MNERVDGEGSKLQALASQLDASEARLKSIIERSPDAYLVIDEAGVIRYVNPAAARLFGLEESKLLGRPFGFPLTAGETTDIDIVNPREGGRIAEMRVVETDWAGERAHVAALRDITERKRAEQAHQDSERRLALALEAAGSAVWELDVVTGKLHGDEMLHTILGYVIGELATANDLIAHIHEDDRQGVPEIISDLIQGKREKHYFEVRMRARDGNWRWVLSQAVVAERDGHGKALRLIGTLTDTTDRRRAEDAIRSLNAELEERVQEKTAELERSRDALLTTNMELERFAHAAAHDLQAPLRSILGFAQLLQEELREGRTDRADEWLTYVVDSTKRLQNLIRDLLAYTRLDARATAFETVDMGRLFGEVVSALSALIEGAGAEVSCGELPVVMANRTQMGQLLQNLIENSITYNRTKPPRVEVGARRQGREWVFSVADNGIGIDPKDHQRIFEMFRRLHSQAQIPGSGIGLAICQRIVQGHGGRIWVESEPGQGSTFHFTLPDREAENPPAAE